MTGRLLVVALCVCTAGGLLRVSAASDIAPPARLSALPLTIDTWRGRDDPRLDAETERATQADSYLLRTYVHAPVPVEAPIGLYVAYYATQRSGHTIHSPLNCLPGTGWEWLERGHRAVRLDSGDVIDVNRGVAQRDADKLLLYYWFQSRGRVVASEYANKLLLVRDAVTLHRSDGALVRVTARLRSSAEPGEAVSFIRALYPALERDLPE